MAFIGKQPAKAAITSTDITDGIVTADKLASNAVTTAKINADAVTDAKIADDVVGTEHLTAGEVDTTALGADAVTAAKIADDAISEEHLDVTAITGHTAETSAADADTILIHDDSASALKKMTRSNFLSGVGTAGLTSSSGHITITDGDLIFGGSGHGVYLGVTSSTASNLLDDYEEGTFTPTFIDQNNTQATSYTNNSSASYTKIGNICYVMMDIEFNSIDSSNLGSYAGIGGYPFTCSNAQSSMTGQLALYQTEFGSEEFGTTIEHNKANGIFYHNGAVVSPGTIGTQLRAFFNFAYKTA